MHFLVHMRVNYSVVYIRYFCGECIVSNCLMYRTNYIFFRRLLISGVVLITFCVFIRKFACNFQLAIYSPFDLPFSCIFVPFSILSSDYFKCVCMDIWYVMYVYVRV